MNLTPYLRDPISFIGDTRVKWLMAIAPTQSGKTVLLQIAVADAIEQDPGNFLYVLPDEKMGRKHMQEKIIRVIEETPMLQKHTTGKVRDMSKQGIQLDNMTIYPGWAGSLGSMSSFPMKRAALDEVRLMKLEIGAESNAIQLTEDRLTTYLDMGIGQGYMVSTPSIEGDLLHNQLDVKNTAVYFWQVPCPECGEYQALSFFTHVKFIRKEERAACICPQCGGEFTGDDKKQSWNNQGMYVRRVLNDAGKWVDTPVVNGVPEREFKVKERMVFWWDSLVSPFRSTHRIWGKYIETKDKLHDYKNFVQCWLATFWVEDVSKTSAVKLRERCAPYEKRIVHPMVKVVTTGIDTQDNGFCVCVRGFGEDGFTCLIDEFFIESDMATANVSDIVRLFKQNIFNSVYVGEGVKWMSSFCAIDTGGHRTRELYSVASEFPHLLMIKGQNTQNTRISYNKDKDLYLVRTYEYLDETENKADSKTYLLPQNVSKDYLTQFCNIRKVREVNKKTGETKIIWKKTGRCDYRMADVHCWICLDIPTDQGILRHEIDKPDFTLNPFKSHSKKSRTARAYDPAHSNYEEQRSSDDFVGAGNNWI